MPPDGHAPLRVFLSHSSELREFPRQRSYLAAAEAAVVRARHVSLDMEYFAARSSRPADVVREEIQGADVYVGIVGFRHGTAVPDHSGRSYTELEFETAGALGIPRLIFMLSDDAEGPATMFLGFDGQQAAFRSQLEGTGLVLAKVSSPDALELAVFHTLSELSVGDRSAFPSVIYDSDTEVPAFASWSYFAARGVDVTKFTRPAGHEIGMNARDGEPVGLNKAIPRLTGTIALQYRIEECVEFVNQVYFAAIPMQETGPGRQGLIEVGTAVQADPRNPTSVYRHRHFVAQRHYFDGKWHDKEFPFDFADLDGAFYTIFAPRLNEGLPVTADARLTIRRVRVTDVRSHGGP